MLYWMYSSAFSARFSLRGGTYHHPTLQRKTLKEHGSGPAFWKAARPRRRRIFKFTPRLSDSTSSSPQTEADEHDIPDSTRMRARGACRRGCPTADPRGHPGLWARTSACEPPSPRPQEARSPLLSFHANPWSHRGDGGRPAGFSHHLVIRQLPRPNAQHRLDPEREGLLPHESRPRPGPWADISHSR